MRLFVALPLPGKTQTALARILRVLQEVSTAVRWVKPENTHLTLRFLGDTDPSMMPELVHLIDLAARQRDALELRLDRLGAFPNMKKPRVYWIGTTDTDAIELLAGLANKIEVGVRQLGFQAEEKHFKPHLTLGRVKQRDELNKLTRAIEAHRLPSLEVPLTRIALIHSTLTPRGSLYKTLHESPLAGV